MFILIRSPGLRCCSFLRCQGPGSSAAGFGQLRGLAVSVEEAFWKPQHQTTPPMSSPPRSPSLLRNRVLCGTGSCPAGWLGPSSAPPACTPSPASEDPQIWGRTAKRPAAWHKTQRVPSQDGNSSSRVFTRINQNLFTPPATFGRRFSAG